MAQQRASGILSQATMYLERAPSGAKPTSYLVMEYADKVAYAKRNDVKSSGKKDLLANPVWQKISETKESYRSDISKTASIEVRTAGVRASAK